MSKSLTIAFSILLTGLCGCILEEESWVSLSPPEDGMNLPSECNGNVVFVENQGQVHLPQEPFPTYEYNPPTSGDHYPYWAIWGVAQDIIPQPYWLHNLEHGGVAILYRCDESTDCDETRTALAAIVEKLPVDPGCETVEGVDRRIIVTEDPLLPEGVNIAAVAWEWSYTASCVVEEDLLLFIEEHYGNAPEDFCAQGYFDPLGPSPWPESGVGMSSDSDASSSGGFLPMP